MPKIALESLPQSNTTGYPAPFDAVMAGRWFRRLAPATGLTLLGASHVMLKPGAWSAQRHWHEDEDELVVMLAGEAVLVEEGADGAPARTLLRAGDIATFPAGVQNGHHIVNESEADCAFVAVSAGPGLRSGGSGAYPDIDMVFGPDGYAHKDGTPYPTRRIV